MEGGGRGEGGGQIRDVVRFQKYKVLRSSQQSQFLPGFFHPHPSLRGVSSSPIGVHFKMRSKKNVVS